MEELPEKVVLLFGIRGADAQGCVWFSSVCFCVCVCVLDCCMKAEKGVRIRPCMLVFSFFVFLRPGGNSPAGSPTQEGPGRNSSGSAMVSMKMGCGDGYRAYQDAKKPGQKEAAFYRRSALASAA